MNTAPVSLSELSFIIYIDELKIQIYSRTWNQYISRMVETMGHKGVQDWTWKQNRFDEDSCEVIIIILIHHNLLDLNLQCNLIIRRSVIA